MKTIPLPKGKQAIVDDEDYEWLSVLKWVLTSQGSVSHQIQTKERRTCLLMHQLVLRASLPRYVKHKVRHINGNKLDNRKANLKVL
jgi:hypothetical protein